MSSDTRKVAFLGLLMGATTAIGITAAFPAGAAPADVFHTRSVSKSATLLEQKLDERADVPHVPTHGVLTSPYGWRWGSLHTGIDIANAVGTPIWALRSGEVIDAGPAAGYGQWVRLRHRDGSVSLYGHVEDIYVAVGDKVTAGQEIATMGNRGFSTGPHLHFEYWPDGQAPIDPVPWLVSMHAANW